MYKKANSRWAVISLLAFLLTSCMPINNENSDSIVVTSSASPETVGTLYVPEIENAATSFIPKPRLIKNVISGKIVYSLMVQREPLRTQLFVKDLNTGEIKQLTNSGSNSHPRWSPDGSQIVYENWSEGNSFDIYLMDSDGSNQRSLVATSARELLANWSPDGSKIVFVSDKDGKDEIYIMDLRTESTTKITNNFKFATAPEWSSDGTRIAFVSDTGGAGRSQIFTMNIDGTNVRQLTNYNIDNFDGGPTWCPDNSCIIFMRFVKGSPKLMYLDLATKEVIPLLMDIFNPEIDETRLARSSARGYITFSASQMFYTMDMKTGEIYSLGVNAFDLSLYP